MNHTIAQVENDRQEALQVRPSVNLLLTPVMNIDIARQRLQEFQSFVKEYLREGEDFGTIPGTPKPTLYKPGSDKLCELYGLADSYEITNRIEDWDRNLFDYEIRCTLLSKRDGSIVAMGLGSCNSFEGRYRWRQGERKCPTCGKATIIKGKEEYGGGWICFAKKGGCGAKFKTGDQAVEGQTIGRVENDDIPTLKNTILKMAKKRAKVDATLAATRSSGIFTQDVEDFPSASELPHNQYPEKEDEGGDSLGEMAVQLQKLMEMPCFTAEQRDAAKQFLNSRPSFDALQKKLNQTKSFVSKATREESKKTKAKTNGVAEPEEFMGSHEPQSAEVF